jgi:hypothetical protein
MCVFYYIAEGRRKKEEGRRKKEEAINSRVCAIQNVNGGQRVAL